MRTGVHIKPLGDRVPKLGNRLTRAVGAAILRLFGWRIEGELPNREKFVTIFAPHTTGLDFPLSLVALIGMGVRASWMGVNWMFKYPLMRKLGGVEINRGAALGVVAQSIENFKNRDHHVLVLAPEGTRKKVVSWKTGFYRIADGAGVPILMAVFDHKDRCIRVGPTFETSGDYEADMAEHVRPVYARMVEKFPDQFGI